ncbi:hypothetical protein [Synechococcus sp. MIT S1220]|uniref:hypothetical protein n=1 Tax=Synechococcus sp. MIT S1220 TaxID=3082549 RepID=UPI0039AFCCED
MKGRLSAMAISKMIVASIKTQKPGVKGKNNPNRPMRKSNKEKKRSENEIDIDKALKSMRDKFWKRNPVPLKTCSTTSVWDKGISEIDKLCLLSS